MKLDKIETLLKAAKAKSDAEKARFGAIKSARDALLAAARETAAIRSKPFEIEGEATGGDLSLHARYLAQLDRAETEYRSGARMLEPDIETRKSVLQTALGKEAALRKLSEIARAGRRKASADREEADAADFVRLQRSAATARRAQLGEKDL